VWAEQWAKEGKEVDWQRLMPPRGFFRSCLEKVGGGAYLRVDLPQPEDGQGLCERLCATGEAFVYAAMTRLMVRRLARA
jgi:putative transposase